MTNAQGNRGSAAVMVAAISMLAAVGAPAAQTAGVLQRFDSDDDRHPLSGPARLVEAKASMQFIGPGVGAQTEDPRAVLRVAVTSLTAVKNATYDGTFQGEGSRATYHPVENGSVALSKLSNHDPLVAKLAARGTFFPTGSDEGRPFATAFDGRTISKLRPGTKTL
jgi:hypothetical protein